MNQNCPECGMPVRDYFSYKTKFQCRSSGSYAENSFIQSTACFTIQKLKEENKKLHEILAEKDATWDEEIWRKENIGVMKW